VLHLAVIRVRASDGFSELWYKALVVCSR